MRLILVSAVLLVTVVYANRHPHYDFKVSLDEIQHTNLPKSYNLVDERAIEIPKELLNGAIRPRDMTASLNEYADRIFANVGAFMMHHGLDPAQLPDEHSGFNYTFIITYHGELDLTVGWLQDVSTIHRGGDVLVSYSSNDNYVVVEIPIEFDDLQFSYDYSAKIMNLGPTGGIEGSIRNVRVSAKLGFNTQTLVASLDEFYILDAGHITFHFTGNVLVDWLLNILSDVVLLILKEVLLLVIESIIRSGLNAVVNLINELVDSILHPTPPTTTEPPAELFGKWMIKK